MAAPHIFSTHPAEPFAAPYWTDGLAIDPRRALFIVVSFEGPDPYSQAGGLGVRVSGLVETLSQLGYETHLFFIGDPAAPGEERRRDSRLVLHRWGQWISANCRGGVYDGEAGKVEDLTRSLPPFLLDQIIAPAIAAGRLPIVLLEEWQTAECATRLADRLVECGVRDRALIAWNANNPYGFERINWSRLASSVMITTISRHMRSIIRACGADARVIPNGIPEGAFTPVERRAIANLRATVDSSARGGFLFKMARWEREKGWTQALDAMTRVRGRARPPVLLARSGGPSGPGVGLATDAQARGLRVTTFGSEGALFGGMGSCVAQGANVIDLRFAVSPALARTLYAAADGVLANSVSEPFGLVGLEAMAAGGVAFTGGTGEDYAVDRRNAVVLETLDPGEIVTRWDELTASPARSSRLRRAARRTARDYEWSSVVSILLNGLERQAWRQGMLVTPPVSRPTSRSPLGFYH